MKKLILSLVIIPLFAFVLIGCGSDDNGNGSEESYESGVVETEGAADVEETDEATDEDLEVE